MNEDLCLVIIETLTRIKILSGRGVNVDDKIQMSQLIKLVGKQEFCHELEKINTILAIS